MNYVSVKFEDYEYAKAYSFLNDIEGLAVGDKVVADTTRGLQVGTISKISDTPINKATKYLVQKVDLEKHEARKAKAKQQAELKKKMEARRKQLQENEIYRILAKEDEEMAKMLEEFDNLK